jgi:hypothetical protein
MESGPRFTRRLAGFAPRSGLESRGDEVVKPALPGLSYERAGSPVEFANRIRHEGLPLARLWENHSALISLGLNPKGKPGLWLVQKTH